MSAGQLQRWLTVRASGERNGDYVQRLVTLRGRAGRGGRAVSRVRGSARGADGLNTALGATDGMPHNNGHERRAAPAVADDESKRQAQRGLHQVVLLIFSDVNLMNRFICFTCFDRAHSQIIGSGCHSPDAERAARERCRD